MTHNMKNPLEIEKQWEWLAGLAAGTRVIARNGQEYLKLAEGETDHINHFVNMKTGKLIHYSYLASEKFPPRKYGCISLF